MQRPVKTYTKISSRHGDAGTGMYKKHLGYDYAGDEGRIVAAPVSGTVTQSYLSASIGNTVEIREDGNGRLHRLAHLKTRTVQNGARVSEGQTVGSTGGAKGKAYSGTASTGPHLHWDVRSAGTTINDGFAVFLDPEALLVEASKPPAPAAKIWIPASAVGMDVILSRSVSSWRVYEPGTSTVKATLNPAKNGGRYLVVGLDSLPNRVLIDSPTHKRVSLPVDGDATFAPAI